MGDAEIRELRAGEVASCEAILRALPDWFGIEEALRDYVRDVPVLETLVADGGDGIAGFLTLKEHGPRAAEIHVMGVRPERYGHGLGGALVEEAQRRLRARGVEFLQVKTLGPSRPNAAYERTRGFYLRMGFVPLEENRLWGEGNPCLILVKHLACAAPR
ncbi:GNAT family N-acetyltransferase [bacterium]|nr:GNAT family N-acetyltransferase [bacterium]